MPNESKHRSISLNESRIRQREFVLMKQNNLELAEKVAQLQRTCSNLQSDLDCALKQKFSIEQKIYRIARFHKEFDSMVVKSFHKFVDFSTDFPFLLGELRSVQRREGLLENCVPSSQKNVETDPSQSISDKIEQEDKSVTTIKSTLEQFEKTMEQIRNDSHVNTVDQFEFISRGGHSSSTNSNFGTVETDMDVEEPSETQCTSSRRLSVIPEDATEADDSVSNENRRISVGSPYPKSYTEITNSTTPRFSVEKTSVLCSKDFEDMESFENISSANKKLFQEDGTSAPLDLSINKTQRRTEESPENFLDSSNMSRMLSSTPVSKPPESNSKRRNKKKKERESDEPIKTEDMSDENTHFVKKCKRQCTSYKYNPLSEILNVDSFRELSQTNCDDSQNNHSRQRKRKSLQERYVSVRRGRMKDLSHRYSKSCNHKRKANIDDSTSENKCLSIAEGEALASMENQNNVNARTTSAMKKSCSNVEGEVSTSMENQNNVNAQITSVKESSTNVVEVKSSATMRNPENIFAETTSAQKNCSPSNVLEVKSSTTMRNPQNVNAETTSAQKNCSPSHGRLSTSKSKDRRKRRTVVYTEPRLNKKMRRED